MSTKSFFTAVPPLLTTDPCSCWGHQIALRARNASSRIDNIGPLLLCRLFCLVFLSRIKVSCRKKQIEQNELVSTFVPGIESLALEEGETFLALAVLGTPLSSLVFKRTVDSLVFSGSSILTSNRFTWPYEKKLSNN